MTPPSLVGPLFQFFFADCRVAQRRASPQTVALVGLPTNKRAAKTGGGIAHRARVELESKTGRKVVTGENYLPPGKAKKSLQS